jgi:hypothetical protein
MHMSFEEWWLAARELIRKEYRRRFDSLVILMSWMLWKQRNGRVFGNTRKIRNASQLVHLIKEEFRVWEHGFSGGRRYGGRE